MILPRLKLATQARHAALESRSVLLDPGLSHATYRESLRRFFGYYAALEARMLRSHAWCDAGLAYGDRLKTPLLARDLAVLGVDLDELAQAPLCLALPDLRSAARIFGCLYVIEGATLGGQIITRHLQASVGVTPQSGAAFFGGYGAHTGSQWKAFGVQLNNFALRSGSDDQITAGANETFATLDRWLYPGLDLDPDLDPDPALVPTSSTAPHESSSPH